MTEAIMWRSPRSPDSLLHCPWPAMQAWFRGCIPAPARPSVGGMKGKRSLADAGGSVAGRKSVADFRQHTRYDSSKMPAATPRTDRSLLWMAATAMGIATMSKWAFNLLVALTFPILVENLGAAYTFWLYALISVGSLVFCLRFAPETKGRTLEEIGGPMDRRTGLSSPR